MRLMFWTGFWVFLADQASKWIVVHWMDLISREYIQVLPPWINFRMAWNPGVNFGLLRDLDLRWVLIAFAFVISGLVVYWVLRDARLGRSNRWAEISAGVLVGGAMGNVIDRVLYGAVADFLNFSLPGWTNPYAFNIADIGVFAGAAGMLIFAGEGQKSQSSDGSKPPSEGA